MPSTIIYQAVSLHWQNPLALVSFCLLTNFKFQIHFLPEFYSDLSWTTLYLNLLFLGLLNLLFLSLLASWWSQTCLSLNVSTFQFYFDWFNSICQNTETTVSTFYHFYVFKYKYLGRLVQLYIERSWYFCT